MSKSPVTCHILDSSLGKPAAGVTVIWQELIDNKVGGEVEVIATSETDADGRCMQLWPLPTPMESKEERARLYAGKLYKVIFHTKDYFESTGRKCFYPWVEITFEVASPQEHYHIPLLISPYSYTTYRGS